MEVCCCSTSSSVLAGDRAGRRLAAPAASAAARYWGAAGVGRAVVLAHPLRPAARPAHAPRRARRGGGVIRAVFERFTERAVKAVVLSQREARGLGEGAVAPRLLLLGLVAEDPSDGGFLSSGINIERAREACRGIGARAAATSPSPSGSGLDTDVPFSGSCKRVFEVAVEFSRNMGCSFISPEHLALALFTLDDPTTNSLLKRLSCFTTGAKHEAGYDAFMTGCVFAQLCAYLDIKFEHLSPKENLAADNKLQTHVNLLSPCWNSGTVVDLNTGTERPDSGYKRRYPVAVYDNVVLIWGFQSNLRPKDIKDCICKVFGPASLTSVFSIDSTPVLVQFSKQESVNNFLDLKAALERTYTVISVLHPLSSILEGGQTRAAKYDTYRDICSSSVSKFSLQIKLKQFGKRMRST